MSPITPGLLLQWFIKDIKKIILFSLLFAAISVVYSLSLPNTYSSSGKVASNLSDSKSMGGALSNLGGLASLAGVSLGGDGLSPEVLKEMLNSTSFLASFIKAYQLEKEIMAAESYDPVADTFSYDEKVYDINSEQWVRDYKFPQSLIPDGTELVEKFKENFRTDYDRKTKLISLNFTSLSPVFSQRVLNDLIFHFNNYLRKIDAEDSTSNIKYLKEQLGKSSYREVKVALQQIMEEQYKKLALAETREQYALRVIESPMMAAKKSGPKRAFICIAITLFGTLFSILILWSVRIFRL
ncbi:Wzz/FepE/Etk N-terminal domain-containing protein [Thalassomonas sp. RHCl1]|uniref:Wzz/FepE/Etk N-terminal domain-containing protein n=1 Tax=Thalassomonas sp. RHCl1 TaxID=2995320 RepID=UPI00248AD4AD|nr:Wzz/FepE/Etk N-terminal domain-containing protein [Thalassomonas sp. RHCl1]